MKLTLIAISFTVSLQLVYSQDDMPPGSSVIITAESAQLYAYPDENSQIVASHRQGYVDRLGPYPDEAGWAFLSEQVAYIRLEDSGLALRTVALQDELQDAALREIEADPNNIAAWLRYGSITASRQNYAAAIESYTHIIEIDPNNQAAYAARGWTYRQINKYDLSVEDYKQALELGELDAYHLIGAGLSYYRANLFDEAEELYKQAIELYPDAYFAYNNLGVLYARQGDIIKELEYYDLALTINPIAHSAYYNRYHVYKNRNDIPSAIENLTTALEVNPYNPDNYANLARAYAFDLNDPVSALDYINLALEIDPKSSQTYETLALINAYVTYDVEAAMENFRIALILNPYNVNAFDRAAIYHARRGDFETALVYYEEQFEWAYQSPRYYLFKAQIHYALNDYENTRITIDQFFEIGESDDISDFSVAFLILGMTALQEGDYETAAEHYRYAFLTTPEWTKNWSNHRGLRLIDARAALAQTYSQAIMDNPDEGDNYLLMGHNMMEFGFWEAAVYYYQQYLTLEDNPSLGQLVALIESFQ